MQRSYDPLDHDYDLDPQAARKAAIQARNKDLKAFKAAGRKAYGWTLANQLRQYAGFGIPDGRVRNVYYITVD